VGSILSKKLSEGLDALVLDVKCGSGAIFRDPGKAEVLAKALIRTAKGLGLPTAGVLTDMEQPLGSAVGNALEVRQAVEILHGDLRCEDYVEVTLRLGGWMLALSKIAANARAGERMLERRLKDASALSVFKKMVKAQGGDSRVADDPDKYLPKARKTLILKAARSGYVTRLDALTVGRCGVSLGAGREKMEDGLDYGAGILLRRKIGDRVSKGEELARLFAGSSVRLNAGRRMLESAVDISIRRPQRRAVIRRVWR
jgi:thymidine phosphorylase